MSGSEFRLVCDPKQQGYFNCTVDGFSCDENERAERVREIEDEANAIFSSKFTLAQIENWVVTGTPIIVKLINRSSELKDSGYERDHTLYFETTNSITDLGDIDDPNRQTHIFEIGGRLSCQIVKDEPQKDTPHETVKSESTKASDDNKVESLVESRLKKLKDLHDKGLITDKEFADQKNRILKDL